MLRDRRRLKGETVEVVAELQDNHKTLGLTDEQVVKMSESGR